MPTRLRSRRLARSIGFALAGLVILLLLAAGAAAVWLSRADLKPLVERATSDALGRRVTLGSFQVRWADPLRIDFTDLAIANAPWGSKPEMVSVGKFSAQLEVGPLLRGVPHYRQLRMSDVTVVLERDPDGIGNWTFGGRADASGLVPKDRTQFPTLIDFLGERGLITYRTRSGNTLRIRLDRVAISALSEHTPTQLLADGAYNGVTTRLEATAEPYATLRDAAVPFGTRFTLAGPDTDIAFNGTLEEPLDFEGARGELSVAARSLDDIVAAMSGKQKVDLPLTVAGVLARDGDHWSLDAAKGQLKQSDFSGALALIEGKPKQPDDIALDLGFSVLDVDAIAAAFGNTANAPLDALPLHPEGWTAVNATLDITASNLVVTGRTLRTATLDGRLAGGDVTLRELSFALGGGRLRAAGTLTGEDQDGHLALRARLAKAEIASLARELGATGAEIRGRLDAAAVLSMAGATVGAALTRSDGAAVLLVRNGQVAQSLIEQLSADLRGLFRERHEYVPVACLLGIVTLKDGIGVISPLRLESREAVALGAGKIDLARQRLDLTVRTERDSTSFFALDIPVRISGPFDRINAAPLPGRDEDWLRQPTAIADTLPPDLQEMATGSACRE